MRQAGHSKALRMSDPAAASPTNPCANVNRQTTNVASAPGWRTTEFWLTVALIVLSNGMAFANLVPGEHAVVASMVLATVYKCVRTYVKVRLSKDAAMVEMERIVSESENNALTGSDAKNGRDDVRGSASMGALAAVCILGGLALLAVAFLSGCASTNVYRGGRKILSTQADAAQLEFRDGNTSLKVVGLNHSTPTRAGGSVVGTAGTAVGGVATALLSQGIVR